MFNLCNIFQFIILNAPDYTVSDEDIIKFIWKDETSIQINTFCSAGNKLGRDWSKLVVTFASGVLEPIVIVCCS